MKCRNISRFSHEDNHHRRRHSGSHQRLVKPSFQWRDNDELVIFGQVSVYKVGVAAKISNQVQGNGLTLK